MAAVSETTTTVAWTIEAGDAGTRIDAFLAAQLPWRSRRSLVGLLDDGAATVEGRRVKKSHRLAVGQRVELTVPAAAVPTEAIAAIELPILFEDDDLVVVNKPSGLAVHPAVTCPHVHVLARLAHRYTVEAPSPNTEAAVVHRLDRETSGALALARRREQVAFYAAQFERRTVRKRYVAVVRGEPPERGEIVHALAVVDGEPVRVASDGKPSRTEFSVLERAAGHALVEIDLHTGRKHQIRVHFAAEGWPLVYDGIYGCKDRDAWPEDARVMLHAARLQLEHRTEGPMTFEAPLPPDMQRVWQVLKERA